MIDIKTKKNQEVSIKKLDRAMIIGKNIKSNIISVKDKTKENYEKNENTAQEYAENKVNNTMHDIIYYTPRLNRKGKQSFEKTIQNIEKGQVQIKKAQKGIKNVKIKGKITIDKAKRNIKRVQNTVKSARKTVKTAEETTKATIKATSKGAKTSTKLTQKTVQTLRATAKATIKTIQVATKATITALKTTATTAKTVVSAIIAGSWIAIIIILIVCLIGMGYSIFMGEDIGTGNRIVTVALSEVGNVGGEKFWRWYGFTSHVEWCAIFVSWCANECGYIESGTIPKFSSCKYEGVPYFKEKGIWQERGYIAKAGDIIFFDWEQDGLADHVGIVHKTENETVYTIEGNSGGDTCRQKEYNINSNVIYGYGTPMYE